MFLKIYTVGATIQRRHCGLHREQHCFTDMHTHNHIFRTKSGDTLVVVITGGSLLSKSQPNHRAWFAAVRADAINAAERDLALSVLLVSC